MELQDVRAKYNIEAATERIEATDKIIKLNPPQGEAAEKGLLDRKNLVRSVPIGSGKTFVAELVAISTGDSTCSKGGN